MIAEAEERLLYLFVVPAPHVRVLIYNIPLSFFLSLERPHAVLPLPVHRPRPFVAAVRLGLERAEEEGVLGVGGQVGPRPVVVF